MTGHNGQNAEIEKNVIEYLFRGFFLRTFQTTKISTKFQTTK